MVNQLFAQSSSCGVAVLGQSFPVRTVPLSLGSLGFLADMTTYRAALGTSWQILGIWALVISPRSNAHHGDTSVSSTKAPARQKMSARTTGIRVVAVARMSVLVPAGCRELRDKAHYAVSKPSCRTIARVSAKPA